MQKFFPFGLCTLFAVVRKDQHLHIQDFAKLMLIASANHCVYHQQFCTGLSNRINVLQDAQAILITQIMQNMLEQVSVCSTGHRLEEIAALYIDPAF